MHQYKFLRFEVGMDTRSDTMLNSMKHMITNLHEFKWEEKASEDKEEFIIDQSITHGKIVHTEKKLE